MVLVNSQKLLHPLRIKGSRLAQAGRPREAIAVLSKAYALLKPACEALPHVFDQEFGCTVINLANALDDVVTMTRQPRSWSSSSRRIGLRWRAAAIICTRTWRSHSTAWRSCDAISARCGLPWPPSRKRSKSVPLRRRTTRRGTANTSPRR